MLVQESKLKITTKNIEFTKSFFVKV